MFTKEERAKLRQLVARWKAGEKVFDAGKRVEKTDATTVQRQEPAQPIKRNFIAEAQRKHAAEAVGPDTRSSYQRKQALAAKLYANRQYQKAKDDAKRAEGMELLMKTMSPSTYVEAATGLDLGTVGRLITDAAAFGSPSLIKQGFNFASKQYGKYAVRNMLKRSIQKTSTPTLISWEDARRFMSSPQITAENAVSITPEVTHFYHGSPVRFDTFSADFIGSGEGGSKVMRGINLWPKEKIANAPKLANIKSPDAPLHLGVSSTPLGGELNPTVYDVSGRGLKLYTATPREVKGLSQSDLISQGYDGIQTPNQVTVFPESIGKLSIDKQSTIDEFILAHPEVERWTPWTTDNQKMQNIIDMGKMSKWTPEQWTAAQDAAIARGDMAEAQRLRDLHFKAKTPNNKITSKLYHGTDAMWTEYNPGFFSSGSGDQGVFGKGLYLSQYPEVSKPYGKNMMELYAYSKNPYTADRGFELFDDAAYAFNRYENSEELFPVLKGKDAVTSPRIVMEDGWKFHYEPNEEVVIPRGEQIKSADAVTYDNKGVRIPLGKRDNFSIADIRYGIIPPIIGYSLYNKYGLPEIFVTPRGNRVIAPRRSIFEDGGF